MTIWMDTHLSAEAISAETIAQLESLGFKEDFFRNNRNSRPPHYHASYKEHLPEANDEMWENALALLKSDSSFRGCLEEEAFSDELRYELDTRTLTIEGTEYIHPFVLEICKPGEHKACDIHINIDLELTSLEGLKKLQEFNFISFEREITGKMRRIHSLTFENFGQGKEVFEKLYVLLKQIPGLVGKMKLEKVTRFMVHPTGAEQLPIVRDAFARSWLLV